ncbi:MAG: RNA methyltransferase [Chloroflexi bacterium]|nr:RNA methyltransferase [Chloroflexota bacterium]
MPFRGTITNAQNPHIRLLRAFDRRSQPGEHLFMLEGLRLVQAACNAGYPLRQVFVSDSFAGRHPAAINNWQAAGLELWRVNDAVFKSLGETVSPQGVAALAERPSVPIEKLQRANYLVLLDNLRDPGNLGTILRTAQATAMEGVLLSTGCVDVFSPKVVRAGMGAHFGLDIVPQVPWETLGSLCAKRVCVLADAHAAELYWTADWSGPIVLIISNEASGPSPEARGLAEHTVRLPMAEGAESLNAAVAGSVLMYEIYRRRLNR